jgi:hypothetical protein
MSTIYTGATISLDGYMAGPDESGFDRLFQWYANGDVEMSTTHANMTFRMMQASVDHVSAYLEQTGALVVGRHLFDITKGWGGIHARPAGRRRLAQRSRAQPLACRRTGPFASSPHPFRGRRGRFRPAHRWRPPGQRASHVAGLRHFDQGERQPLPESRGRVGSLALRAALGLFVPGEAVGRCCPARARRRVVVIRR